MGGLTRLARLASPRHRSWFRLLRSLDLDPEALPRPIQEPAGRDFFMCGIPRSGTSLLAAALYQPPRVVTVLEPWDGLRLAPAPLFASIREEVRSGSLSRGRLDVERLVADGAVAWGRDGQFPHEVHVNDDYLLGIKWPAFWQYLDPMPATKFLVCVRSPASVIRSFKEQPGSLRRGFEYDVAFNRTMNRDLAMATDEDALRRVLLYEYVASGIVPHLHRPNVFIVRYERWASDAGGLLEDIGTFLGEDVSRSSVVIDERDQSVQLSDREVELIAEHCPSATTLGYPIPDAHEIAREWRS